MVPQILVVDDSRLAAMVVQNILNPLKIECRHVKSADDLFGLRGKQSVLREFQPDVILLDIVMPGMSGIDILRKLKVWKGVDQVPVVMLSSATNERNVAETLQLGAAGFLAKPINPEKLLSELIRVTSESGKDTFGRHVREYRDIERRGERGGVGYKVGPGDLSYMLEILDDDVELMKELIQVFVEDAPGEIKKLQDALTDKDAEAVRKSAHRFKGMVGNFGAPEITAMAFKLEQKGADQDLEDGMDIYYKMFGEVDKLLDGLKQYMENEKGAQA